AKRKGTQIDIPGLERELGVPIVPINPRKNKGLEQLKKAIEQSAENYTSNRYVILLIIKHWRQMPLIR
ncbi:MAG: hypothetical protein ABIN74_10045, partial [Ferruginibacter sp.]